MTAHDAQRVHRMLERIAELMNGEMATVARDLDLIHLIEHAGHALERDELPKIEASRRLISASRLLLIELFRTRRERDQARADLALLQQGQGLLPLTPQTNP